MDKIDANRKKLDELIKQEKQSAKDNKKIFNSVQVLKRSHEDIIKTMEKRKSELDEALNTHSENLVKYDNDLKKLNSDTADLVKREEKLKVDQEAVDKRTGFLDKKEEGLNERGKKYDDMNVDLEHKEMELNRLEIKINKLIEMKKVKV